LEGNTVRHRRVNDGQLKREWQRSLSLEWSGHAPMFAPSHLRTTLIRMLVQAGTIGLVSNVEALSGKGGKERPYR